MTVTPAPPRLEARLRVRQNLKAAMDYRRTTVRGLATACPNPQHSHRSTIGHLLSGYRTTCSPHLARVIEEHLGLPQGNLFDLSLTSGNLDTPTRRKAAA